MYDQLGGGFHRYSTDERWLVPHFEKMLYDNALLLRLYVRAWQVTGARALPARRLRDADYLLREMRHPEGGFFSSQDADSEGVEGRFFVWAWDELVEIARRGRRHGVRRDSRAATGRGRTCCGSRRPVAAVAAELELDPDALERDLEAGARRGCSRPASGASTRRPTTRCWPRGTAWRSRPWPRPAGRSASPRYVEAAVRAADFVLTRLRGDDGRLLRSWRDGRGGRPAFADDHALMAEACLDPVRDDVRAAVVRARRASLADELVRRFHDQERGGFFQTGSDAEALVVRPKDLFDNAVPSGNSAAAEVLLRLAHLTGEPEYERAGASALRLVRDAMAGAPSGFGHALVRARPVPRSRSGRSRSSAIRPPSPTPARSRPRSGAALPAEPRPGGRRAGGRHAPGGGAAAPDRPAQLDGRADGLRVRALHLPAAGHVGGGARAPARGLTRRPADRRDAAGTAPVTRSGRYAALDIRLG